MMEVETTLSSSQESVGQLFASNLPANYGFLHCATSKDDDDVADDSSKDGEEGEEREGGGGRHCLSSIDKDYDLEAAEKQARESSSITPLIKHELKLLIQSRRLSQGKEELRVGFEHPTTYELTQAEVEKRSRRKEQNRRAAKRFRQSKKSHESVLLDEVQQLEERNDELKEKLQELNALKSELLQKLAGHLTLCPTPSLAVLPAGDLLSLADIPSCSAGTPIEFNHSLLSVINSRQVEEVVMEQQKKKQQQQRERLLQKHKQRQLMEDDELIQQREEIIPEKLQQQQQLLKQQDLLQQQQQKLLQQDIIQQQQNQQQLLQNQQQQDELIQQHQQELTAEQHQQQHQLLQQQQQQNLQQQQEQLLQQDELKQHKQQDLIQQQQKQLLHQQKFIQEQLPQEQMDLQQPSFPSSSSVMSSTAISDSTPLPFSSYSYVQTSVNTNTMSFTDLLFDRELPPPPCYFTNPGGHSYSTTFFGISGEDGDGDTPFGRNRHPSCPSVSSTPSSPGPSPFRPLPDNALTPPPGGQLAGTQDTPSLSGFEGGGTRGFDSSEGGYVGFLSEIGREDSSSSYSQPPEGVDLKGVVTPCPEGFVLLGTSSSNHHLSPSPSPSSYFSPSPTTITLPTPSPSPGPPPSPSLCAVLAARRAEEPPSPPSYFWTMSMFSPSSPSSSSSSFCRGGSDDADADYQQQQQQLLHHPAIP